MSGKKSFTLEVSKIERTCAAGEEFGRKCQQEGKIPVLSCEGGCIKGEIARQAANILAGNEGYARGCHGELFTVPHADLSQWIKEAERVVIIDGCPLFCHSRIAQNMLGKDQLVVFDALSFHGKYAHLMAIDDVAETERKEAAKKVADEVLSRLSGKMTCSDQSSGSCGCDGKEPVVASCCG